MSSSQIFRVSGSQTAPISPSTVKKPPCSLLKTALKVAAFFTVAIHVIPYFTQKPNQCKPGSFLGIESTRYKPFGVYTVPLFNHCPEQTNITGEQVQNASIENGRNFNCEVDSDLPSQRSNSIVQEVQTLMARGTVEDPVVTLPLADGDAGQNNNDEQMPVSNGSSPNPNYREPSRAVALADSPFSNQFSVSVDNHPSVQAAARRDAIQSTESLDRFAARQAATSVNAAPIEASPAQVEVFVGNAPTLGLPQASASAREVVSNNRTANLANQSSNQPAVNGHRNSESINNFSCEVDSDLPSQRSNSIVQEVQTLMARGTVEDPVVTLPLADGHAGQNNNDEQMPVSNGSSPNPNYREPSRAVALADSPFSNQFSVSVDNHPSVQAAARRDAIQSTESLDHFAARQAATSVNAAPIEASPAQVEVFVGNAPTLGLQQASASAREVVSNNRTANLANQSSNQPAVNGYRNSESINFFLASFISSALGAVAYYLGAEWLNRTEQEEDSDLEPTSDTESEIVLLEQELRQKEQQVESLQTNKVLLEQELRQKKQQVELLQTKKVLLEQKLGQKKQQVESLQTKKVLLEQELRQKKQQVESLQTNKVLLEQELRQKKQQVELLKKDMEKVNALIEAWRIKSAEKTRRALQACEEDDLEACEEDEKNDSSRSSERVQRVPRVLDFDSPQQSLNKGKQPDDASNPSPLSNGVVSISTPLDTSKPVGSSPVVIGELTEMSESDESGSEASYASDKENENKRSLSNSMSASLSAPAPAMVTSSPVTPAKSQLSTEQTQSREVPRYQRSTEASRARNNNKQSTSSDKKQRSNNSNRTPSKDLHSGKPFAPWTGRNLMSDLDTFGEVTHRYPGTLRASAKKSSKMPPGRKK